jgi:hypothetical protein
MSSTAEPPPSWAILVPTIPRRAESFRRLMDRLLPQVTEHADGYGSPAVIAWLNEGHRLGLGAIRDEMLRYADLCGFEYVSFVDDDDMVPDYYVSEIQAALRLRPDHVGFPIEYWKDGKLRQARVEHSLKWKQWGTYRTARGHADLVRDFTHIDPIRTELARRGSFMTLGPHQPEDRRWVREVRPHLASGTEVFIDRIMYHYYWSPAESAWDAPGKVKASDGTAGSREVLATRSITSPHLFWHPESL